MPNASVTIGHRMSCGEPDAQEWASPVRRAGRGNGPAVTPAPRPGLTLRRLAQFLQEDLKLELSETKTLITHARTSAARFLGYEITTQHANQILTDGRRKANGSIRLRVPGDVIKAKCTRYMSGENPSAGPSC